MKWYKNVVLKRKNQSFLKITASFQTNAPPFPQKKKSLKIRMRGKKDE